MRFGLVCFGHKSEDERPPLLWAQPLYVYSYFRIFHSIRNLQMNLIDMMLQFIICNLFILRLFLDQGLNIFIQSYYDEIGKENAFIELLI